MTPEEKAARRQERMDELQKQREAGALQRALARAASDTKYNFTQRPEGYIDEGNQVIRYYGWSGGKETGKWVAREAPLTQSNYEKYKGLIPAAEFAVKDVRSKMVPTKPGGEGFVIKDGKIETKGNVDKSALGIKSDLDMEKVLGKRPERESAALSNALARAQKSPITNFMERPAGRITDDKIYFYSWIGGKENGEWFLYEAVNNKDNFKKFATLVQGQAFYQPTSIRDVLVPVTNIYGKSWKQVATDKKIVSGFNPAAVENKYNTDVVPPEFGLK